jgi:hypothetical protein
LDKNNAKSDIIFISGRFRSGTSMLWNLFNHLPQYCAYYEPLHPNLLSHIKHVKPKQDHVGIDDYWGNYSNLNDFNKYYSTKFGQQNLYLEKHEKWPELERYIRFLIESSGEKIPVLKFNRMDLRLSWLKNTFPNATIINIDREVFPLWISTRKHLKSDVEKNNESHPDAYDLLQWSVDLAAKFPMLKCEKNRTSYFRHYFIWKLSSLLAKSHADIHLSLENDFFNSSNGINLLAKKLNWDDSQKNKVKQLIQLPKSIENKIIKDNLYSDIESNIDQLFMKLGLTKLFPSSPLEEIKIEYKNDWAKYPIDNQVIIQELLDAMSYQKDELTALVN